MAGPNTRLLSHRLNLKAFDRRRDVSIAWYRLLGIFKPPATFRFPYVAMHAVRPGNFQRCRPFYLLPTVLLLKSQRRLETPADCPVISLPHNILRFGYFGTIQQAYV